MEFSFSSSEKCYFWSGMDKAVGHYRRYEFSEIKKKCEKAGFDIKKIRYVDSIGFFRIFSYKIFWCNTNDGLGSKKSLNFMINTFSNFLRVLTN